MARKSQGRRRLRSLTTVTLSLIVGLGLVSPASAIVYDSEELNCYSSVGSGWTQVSNDAQNTPGTCGTQCTSSGYSLFALSGSQCYCGNALPPSNSISSDSACSKTCNYDPIHHCGGSGLFIVYSNGQSPTSTQGSDSASSTAGSSASTDAGSSTAAPLTTSAPPTSSSTGTTASTDTTASAAATTSPETSGSSSSSTQTTQTHDGSTTTSATNSATTTDGSKTTTSSGSSGSTSTSGTSTTTKASSASSSTGTGKGTATPDIGDANKHKSGGGISGGAIAGIVVGVVCGVALVAVIAFLLFIRHRRASDDDEYYSPGSSPENFKSGGGSNSVKFTGPYPEYPPPPPVGANRSTSHGSNLAAAAGHTGGNHAWGTLSNPVIDQRLNPEMLGDPRISIASLADARDYSRQILKVTNPDDEKI